MSSSPTDIKEYRKLISFLGRQRYNPVRYRLGGTDSNNVSTLTPWVARAIAETAGWPSEIVIVTTQQAWDFRPDGETEPNGVRLTEDLAAAGLPSPTPRIIQEEDQWGQFLVLKDLMRMPATEVFLDISYGFRSLPFFAAAVTAFVRAVDDKTPNIRVFYGAYEARDKITNIAPLWELTEFVALLDWAQALRMFLRTGRAEEAANATRRLGKELAKAWAEGGKQGPRPDLDKLGRTLGAFGADLETLRTGDLLVGRGGSSSSAAMLHEAAQRAKDDVAKHIPPFADVLDRVLSMVQPLAHKRSDLSGDSGRKAVVALAELYLKLGRYLEAAATVREGWVNFYARKAELYPGGEKFDLDERKAAETRAHKCDDVYREVTDRRNDLLHAQYRPQSNAQNAEGVKKTIEGLVQKLKVASCTPRGNVFANVSNHRKETWDENQTQAALALAEHIEDVPFPAVPPDADEKAIEALADECLSRIPPVTSHALVQGEFTLTVALVRRLQARGITCLAATTERQVEEADNGRKISTFRFVRFREYPQIGDCEASAGERN